MGKHPATDRPPITWNDRLAACRTESDVVATCREWLAAWSPQDIAALPPACRPGKLHDADDIATLAVDAVKCQNAAGDSAGPHLRRLATFFSHASTRMAELMGSRSGPPGVDDGVGA